jgi:hypothetical protein
LSFTPRVTELREQVPVEVRVGVFVLVPMLSAVSLRIFRAHRGVDLTLEPLNAIVGPNGAAGRAKRGTAADARSAHQPPAVDRAAMPWTRGSVLLKLLATARRELDDIIEDGEEPRTRREVFSARFEHAMSVLRSPHVRAVEETIEETTKRTLGTACRHTSPEGAPHTRSCHSPAWSPLMPLWMPP